MLAEMITDKESYLNKIKSDWLASKDSFPDFLTEISKETKTMNEQYIQTMSEHFQKQLQKYPRFPLGRKKWRKKTLSIFKDALYNEMIIGIHKSTDQKTIDSFQEEVLVFLRQVRKFAPELSFADIGQAIRNYLVYVMFKEIHLDKSGFNIAAFGYSMLYPFTDNYIDNNEISAKEKAEYNQIIRDKLSGKEVHPKTIHQTKTCELLQAIESLYPRDQDLSIFHLLQMMLDAQEHSIRQQNRELPLTEEERLNISLYKGGISVLIDRYFVKKTITEEDLIFYLNMGFFLQLADDLQDIKTDSEQDYQTIFTLKTSCIQEEKLVNKLLHFVHDFMEAYHAENDTFKNFVLTNCYQLIYLSIIGSKEFFSKEYLNKLEEYLPASYSYIEKLLNNRVEKMDILTQDKYMKNLDLILFD